jgi:hypothetical protein
MDPMTMAAAGAKVIEGIGSYLNSRTQSDALEAAARQALAEAGIGVQLELEQTDRTTARGATLAAASGGGLTGSALAVIDDVARQGVFNARSAIYEGMAEAGRLKYEAKVTRRQGDLALATSLFSGGSTAMGGFAESRAKARQLQRANPTGMRASSRGGGPYGPEV